ncbi:UDP-N-acetylglucosamine:LPS N-acetylglucosamine transferase [Silvimonas terrae]|uniref:UDP-N-acetylglucosamine:LPS N-acetylglucosamine transferase n=1 Tax=Silvimonas terrae TaxID=300266 RepID=A0A840RE20_9NEIS|nr:glycosyltransferase [Silvimonas terrae]MBB5190834.1 UDP-N-acetylglucosamine:LPS N-acetylglucosamine transferase [Silvimonas terrae]
MTKKKILLLSVSAGAGHMRAAEALHRTAQLHFPDVETLHLDAMDYVTPTFRKVYTDWYIKLVNISPTTWGLLYRISSDTDPGAFTQQLRRASERLNTRPLLQAITDFGPDAVICTHFLPAELLMHEINRGRTDLPVWVQVTDFDLHRMWVIPHMRGYFTGNAEIAQRVRTFLPEQPSVNPTGIPIMPAFAQKPDAGAAAQDLGFDPARPVIVLMGGGAGLGQLDEVASALLRIKADFQLVVMAGRNESALKALQALVAHYPQRLFPIGFTDRVDQIMACASFVITKPGGLTTSECLAMGLPMILNSPIPGQEDHNADYLLEQGAAVKAIDTTALVWRVEQLLSQPQQLQTMRDNALRIGRPHAAQSVLRTVLADLAPTRSEEPQALVLPPAPSTPFPPGGWRALLTLGWVLLLAFFFAQVEIQIEGAAGWAAALPTWRIAHSPWLDLFWGGRPMTGYHAWLFPCMALLFHFPLVFAGRFSWRAEARVIACIMLFWVAEDFIWFICNPAFGLARFSSAFIPWHIHWLGPAPVDYWTSSIIAVTLFALSCCGHKTHEK